VALLRLLVQQREEQAAYTVWQRLLELHEPVPPVEAVRFVEFLHDERQPGLALAAWKQFAMSDRTYAPYVPGENAVVNGGFDEDLLGGGFDWKISALLGVTVEVDTTEFHD